MTVTQTLQGYPPPIEHVGVPKVSQQEAGKCVIFPLTLQYDCHPDPAGLSPSH